MLSKDPEKAGGWAETRQRKFEIVMEISMSQDIKGVRPRTNTSLIMSLRHFFHDFRPLLRILDEPLTHPAAYSPFTRLQRRYWAQDDPWSRSTTIRPAVDLTEDGKNYVVEAELPGVKKENVAVRIGDNGRSITIEGKTTTRSQPQNSGEASAPAEEPNTKEISAERTFTGSLSFLRTVWLPQPVDTKSVTAKLEDGVLTVTVPRAEEQGSVQVQVE